MLLTHGMMKGECPINGLGVLLSFLEQIILEGKCSLERPPAKAFIMLHESTPPVLVRFC